MTIKESIEKAVKGGWNPKFSRGMGVIEADTATRTLNVKSDAPTLSYGDMFLDPSFWQALGKVEGWCYHEPAYAECKCTGDLALKKFQEMTFALWEGKTIEQYLETL
jgi:hypothetical protein